MKKYKINNKTYELIKNYKECFDEEEVIDLCTEYFAEFDYILGDYAYDKLRLKGFYESNNKKASKINDIKGVDNYIENYCVYGAKYFLLKKIS